VLVVIATGVCLGAVALLGLVAYLYGISSLQEHRSQDTLYNTFRPALANELAPVSAPVPLGHPIAILTIPAISVRQVVVEGTYSGQLMMGPGHMRNTVFPGQTGVSVIQGKRGTFGAPFSELANLKLGDRAAVTTGQGDTVYRVADVRTSDQKSRPIVGFNRLVLVTANSPIAPTKSVIVTMVMEGKPKDSGAPPVAISPSELPLHGDTSAILPLVLWGQVLLICIAAAVWAYFRFGRWQTYLGTGALMLAVLWCVDENIARLLPNIL
jgi:sortase A